MVKKIINGIGILLCGIFSAIGMSEFYKVRIKNETELYPFGGEGPVPYYYKTAELYSNVNLTWGIIFGILFIIGIWNWKTKKLSKNKLIAIIFGAILIQIFQNTFEFFM